MRFTSNCYVVSVRCGRWRWRRRDMGRDMGPRLRLRCGTRNAAGGPSVAPGASSWAWWGGGIGEWVEAWAAAGAWRCGGLRGCGWLRLSCHAGIIGILRGGVKRRYLIVFFSGRCRYLNVFFDAFDAVFARVFALVADWVQIVVVNPSGLCDTVSQ